MSNSDQRDLHCEELLYFLAYDGSETVSYPEDEVLKSIASLAIQLKPLFHTFSGVTALRKLLECKEAYKRALIVSEAQLIKDTTSSATFYIAVKTVVNEPAVPSLPDDKTPDEPPCKIT